MNYQRLSLFLTVGAVGLGMVWLQLPLGEKPSRLQVGADQIDSATSPIFMTDEEASAGSIQETFARSEVQSTEIVDAAGAIVSHHLPTALPVIAQVYRALATRTQPVRRVIVLGPDHRDLASSPIVTTKGQFLTPFGELEPDLPAITLLTANKIVKLEDTPFQNEHSIGVQAILTRLVFPQAKIVPIVIRSSATVGEAQALGESLRPLLDGTTIVIASVDFSHYYPEKQARALDQESAQRLEENTLATVRNVRSDSTQSLIALRAAMVVAGADDFRLLSIDNSAQWSNDRDLTTGYVSAVYQIPAR